MAPTSRPTLPTAALAAALLAAPLAPSAHADGVEYFGRNCDSTVDAPSTDPGTTRLRLVGGPWYAGDLFDDSSPGPQHQAPADITIECQVVVTDASSLTCGGAPRASATATGKGLAALHQSVDVAIDQDEWFWICTRVTMTHHGDTQVYQSSETVSRP